MEECITDLLNAAEEHACVVKTPRVEVLQPAFVRFGVRSEYESVGLRGVGRGTENILSTIIIDFKLPLSDSKYMSFIEHLHECGHTVTIYGEKFVWELQSTEHHIGISTVEEIPYCDATVCYHEAERVGQR